MIVDTMTFPEISDYLWKTSFSENSMKGVEEIYRRKRKVYQRDLKNWERRPNHPEKYLIFKPVYYKGKNDEKLCIVFYSNKSGSIYLVCFLTFYYCGRKYVAFRPAETGKRVVFYSWHTFQRYSERFLGEPEATIDDIFIGDMLIFNTQTFEVNYTHDGRKTIALISTDGAFLGDEYENCFVAKTFIGESEYFENQKELDREALEILRRYKEEVWGDTLDR